MNSRCESCCAAVRVGFRDSDRPGFFKLSIFLRFSSGTILALSLVRGGNCSAMGIAMKTERSKLQQFIRSIAVGGVATAADLVAIVLLVEGLGVSPLAGNLPALVLGLAVQFFGNKYFAFGDRSRRWVRQGSAFLAVEVGALALNAIAFHIAVSLFAAPYLAARLLCSLLVYVAYSFPLWRLVFQPAIECRQGS